MIVGVIKLTAVAKLLELGVRVSSILSSASNNVAASLAQWYGQGEGYLQISRSGLKNQELGYNF